MSYMLERLAPATISPGHCEAAQMRLPEQSHSLCKAPSADSAVGWHHQAERWGSNRQSRRLCWATSKELQAALAEAGALRWELKSAQHTCNTAKQARERTLSEVNAGSWPWRGAASGALQSRQSTC